MAKKYDIFISHSFKDRTWVRGLAKVLQEKELSVWYDETKVKPGDIWVDRIREVLDESRNVVFLVGEGALKSNWVAAELGASLALCKPIIPVIQEGIPPEDIPGPIRLRRYLPMQKPSVMAEEIARVTSLKQEVEGD